MEGLMNPMAHDDDAFCRWANNDAALGRLVCEQLRHLAAALELTPAQIVQYRNVSLLQEGRDAASRLHLMAREAGFLDAATLFYAQYERLCLALLAFLC